MCGRFQIRPDGRTEALMQRAKASGPLRYADDVAPGACISIIHETAQGREVTDALWWLLLDRKTGKPDYRYPSFNSRSDRLDDPKALSYRPFRESRCIIPASAFIEGLGDRQTYHKIELEDRAIAFGGLYRSMPDPQTGELLHSASIITLPPPEQWRTIHPKSMPLMLDIEDEALVGLWLDPGFRDIGAFTPLLQPQIRWPQRLTPIDRPSKWNPVGASFRIV
jgi:putative SOS response-associated peptidase YedK